MQLRADRSYDVPAIELPDRQKIQRRGKHADPGRAPHGMQQQIRSVRVWLEHGGYQTKNQGYAKDQVGVAVGGQRGDYFCV